MTRSIGITRAATNDDLQIKAMFHKGKLPTQQLQQVKRRSTTSEQALKKGWIGAIEGKLHCDVGKVGIW